MWADAAWKGSWTSFLDTMLQTALLCTTSRNLAVPIDFEKIIIDPVTFQKHLKRPEGGRERTFLYIYIFFANNHVGCTVYDSIPVKLII